MTKTRILSLFLLPVLLFMLVSPTHASTHLLVTGTIPNGSFAFTVTSIRAVGGNTVITGIETGADAGDISGTFVGVATYIIHADGSANFYAAGTETASVLGSPSGTFSWIDSGTVASDGTDSGQFVIMQGAGGLAGLHGVISFHTPFAGADDVYSGDVHFDS